MAESNFVDYVKIYCRSGKGGRGSLLTSVVRNTFRKEGPDGAMEGEEVMCISVVTGITGRSFT